DQAADSAARRFRAALTALWMAPRANQRIKLDDGDIIVVAGSLVSRVQEEAGTNWAKCEIPPRNPWRMIHSPFSAWWRVQMLADGEVVRRLAMRWELTTQIGVPLPGVRDQDSLRALGVRFGAIDPEPDVPARASGGGRLAVLTVAVAAELLDNPADDAESQ